MKKILNALFIIICISLMFMATAYADDNDLIQDGTYVQMGQYNGEPILWRCVSTQDDDENGKLILSDRILCYKMFDAPHEDDKELRFGYGFWIDSNIRAWLNSDKNAGNIVWPNNNPPAQGKMPYDNENGFLSRDNFTDSEKSTMKSVSQWLILSAAQKEYVTNGIENFFQTNVNGTTKAYESFHYGSISDLSHIEGGMCRVTDTVFLMDEIQVYKLWKKHDAYSEPTEQAMNMYTNAYDISYSFNSPYQYWLRTPWGGLANFVDRSDVYTMTSASGAKGVRPAFYLNEDNVKVLSGNGTWNDPYIIDGYGQEGMAVFSQGRQLIFDQQPVNENGRLLVPVRAVAESLGLNVNYDMDTRIITAQDDEKTVTMQIDNPEMGNGTDVIELDAAPKIIGDRTMVPLRAVSEAFDAEVNYIENLNRVVIDKPAPQDFGDDYGLESWQQDRAIENGNFSSEYLIEKYGKKKD